MKMMIEVQGGVVVSVKATQECSLYLVDHDNIKTMLDRDTAYARQAMQPDCITWEEGEDETPGFDGYLDEALSEYETKESSTHTTTILQHTIEYWWRDGYVQDDLDETSEEHIQSVIIDGFNQGELCTIGEDDEEHFGWWKIQ